MFAARAEDRMPWDVADASPPARARFHIAWHEEYVAERLASGEQKHYPLGPVLNKTIIDEFAAETLGMPVTHFVRTASTEFGVNGYPEYLLCCAERTTAEKVVEIELAPHLTEVGRIAGELANALTPALACDFKCAGELHDLGKEAELWQSAMRGKRYNPKGPRLAKTAGAGAAPALLNGFRHELRSAAKVENASELTRYLVASHHGWARPYFEPRSFDPEDSGSSAAQAQRALMRFADLQRHWGPWGLAYLDAVLKSADALASEQKGNPKDV